MADTAPRTPNPTQRLKLTVQPAAVRTMTLEATALAGRIGTDQLGNHFHQLRVHLAADTRQAYHGLLSEARRPFLRIRQEKKGGTAGFAVFAGTCLDKKTSRFTATANLAEHAGNRKELGRRPRIGAGAYSRIFRRTA
jgi:hypothetical protein